GLRRLSKSLTSDQAEDRHHLVRWRTGKRIYHRPRHRRDLHRHSETTTGGRPHAARHKYLSPEATPPPDRTRAHRKLLAQAAEPFWSRTITQNGHQQDHDRKKHLAPQKSKGRRRRSPATPLRRAAEAQANRTFGAHGWPAACLSLVVSSVQTAATGAARSFGLRGGHRVELQK